MSDEMTFTLHTPLTEEEWDMITDVDLDHTPEITFHTKHGKEVVFVKRKTGHWILHPEQKNIFGAKTIECSECGDKCLVQFVEKEKYCRNCGAKMDADNDDIPIEYFESGGK